MEPKTKEIPLDPGDMMVEDWVAGMYRNLGHVKAALWLLVLIEVGKFLL